MAANTGPRQSDIHGSDSSKDYQEGICPVNSSKNLVKLSECAWVQQPASEVRNEINGQVVLETQKGLFQPIRASSEPHNNVSCERPK
jgi:hypothetical protein